MKRIKAMIAVSVGLPLTPQKSCSLERADDAPLKHQVLPSAEGHCPNKSALPSLVFQQELHLLASGLVKAGRQRGSWRLQWVGSLP